MSKLDHFAATELKTEELESVSGGYRWYNPCPPKCPPKWCPPPPKCEPPKHCYPRKWC